MKTSRIFHPVRALMDCVAVILLALLAPDNATAFERYKNDNEDAESNCSLCKGDFTGPTSPQRIAFTWETMGARTDAVQASGDAAGGYSDVSGFIPIPVAGPVTINYFEIGEATNSSRCYRTRLAA